MRGSLFAGLLILAASVSGADGNQTLLSKSGGKFQLPWSGNWSEVTGADVPPIAVAFETKGDPLAMRVSLVAVPTQNDPRAVSEEGLRYFIGKAIEDLQPQAVEHKLEAQPLAGPRKGFFVRATDKAPKPGEYKYVESVIVAVGEVPVFATILFNDAGAADATKARESLGRLDYTGPASPESK
jgi:hypothetical protein